MNRVIAYIDGNNLHYRIKDLVAPSLLWCNVKKFVSLYLGNRDSLNAVRYYTSEPGVNPPKPNEPYPKEDAKHKWEKHITALENVGVEIIKGKTTYKSHVIDLDAVLSRNIISGAISAGNLADILSPEVFDAYNNSKNHFRYNNWAEKKSDVHLAIDLVGDAHKNKYDTAILVSGDADFIPAIEYVAENLQHVKVKVILPPSRELQEIKNMAYKYPTLSTVTFKQADFEKSQLPNIVTLANGAKVERPKKYT